LYQPTVRVRALFGASDELADQILGGATADLFLTADPDQLDRLTAAHCLEAKPRPVLAENTLAAIALAKRDLPIRKAADLIRADLGRIALAGPNVPLGRYTRHYLQGLGLSEAVISRAILLDNSRAVVAAVRGGQAVVGVVYGSDVLNATDCRVVFRVPRG